MSDKLNSISTFGMMAAILLASCAPSGHPGSAGDTGLNAPAMKTASVTPLLLVGPGAIETVHGLRYSFSMSHAVNIIGPDHRADTFNGVPFAISRAAFVDDDFGIMIHAETVADGSGASNYDNLPAAEWPDGNFRSGGPVCFELAAEDIEGEDDPEWLVANGFDPTGILLFGQYFATTADYNDEIVVSVMVKGETCDDETLLTAKYNDVRNGLVAKQID